MMSSYYHQYGHQPTSAAGPTPTSISHSHSHHGGRNRRAPRLSVTQNSNKYRNVRMMKDFTESANVSTFRNRLEASRSFDLEDDMEFCPTLLTDSDMMSIHSANASERSSLASNSPDSSPTQQPQQIAPAFLLNSSSPPFLPPAFTAHQAMKLHQPAATRARNAIPIINPATGITMTSPPQSVSPNRMQPAMGARRW